MYLLDTNVLSEFQRSRPNEGVLSWVESVDPVKLNISVLTVLEIEVGILRLSRRDEVQAMRLRNWLDEAVLDGFEGRTLPITLEISRRAAQTHVPNSKPAIDALLGATASVHGLTVVTRNVKDFAELGVPVFNPWRAPER